MDERLQAIGKYHVLMRNARGSMHIITNYLIAFFCRVKSKVQPHFSQADDSVCFVFHVLVNVEWSIVSGEWSMDHCFVSKICIPWTVGYGLWSKKITRSD